MLDGEVEFGAVNCVHEQSLMQRFGIRQFPSFFLVSPEMGLQVEYHYRGLNLLTEDLPPWARSISTEWMHLFSRSSLSFFTTEAEFQEQVLESLDMWLVVFMGGPHCTACSDAKANVLRVAGELSGVARVGMVDCSRADLRPACHRHGVPESYPFFTLYPKGQKTTLQHMEALFHGGEIPNHLALPLIARVARAALADTLSDSGLAVAPNDMDAFQDDRPPPPPPPPPAQEQYQQPPPRPVFQELPNHAPHNYKYKLLN